MEFENLDEQIPIYVNGNNFELTLTPDFDWAHDEAIKFFYMKKEDTYGAQLRLFNEENKYFITETTKLPKQEKVYKIEFYLDELKYIPQEKIRELFPNADKYLLFQMENGTPNGYEHSIMYDSSGIRDSDGWLIHLCIQPLYKKDGAYTSSVKDGAMHLFYSNK